MKTKCRARCPHRAAKRIMSLVVYIVMLTSLTAGLDFSAYATDLPSSGKCGTNVTYTFDSSTGLLTISGSGAMANYNPYSSPSPFYKQNTIKTVVINNSIKSIGNSVFNSCSGLTSITIPDSVTSIGNGAFCNCTELTSITIPNSVTSIGDTVFSRDDKLIEIYYPGKAEEWNEIQISSNNEALFKATIHYNYVCESHKSAEPVIENIAPSTCTSDGSYDEVVYCYICSSEISRETTIVDAPGHDFVPDSKDPTCTESGFDGFSCSRCGDIIPLVEYPALGHSYKIVDSKAASCTEDGFNTYECERCKTQYTQVLNAFGHNYEIIASSNSTCTAQGYTTYKCSICNDSYTDYYEMLPHTPSEAVIENNVDPTCTANGSYDEVVYCSVCSAELSRETKTVKALGHNYTSVVSKPTCTERGFTTYTCTRCDYSYIGDTVSALGHNYEITDSKAAGCTEAGYITYKCTRCDDSYTETLPAIKHSFFLETKEPTCIEAGYTAYVCKNCGQQIVTKQTEALGHNYEIDSFENGLVVFKCSRCEDEHSDAFADHINERGYAPLDMNDDGIVNAKDYAYILRHSK